ncbi:MAG: trypsin-like peptidase domain-containing protein [bacterium]|nr:MAG: trypsin-like peptidase domain-containing protein [bacterium]
MKQFVSRWERAAPYFFGILFGLSVALLVVSIIMFRRANERLPFLPPAQTTGGSGQVEEERSGAIVAATRSVSPAVVSVNALQTKLVQTYPTLSYRWFERFFFDRSIPRLQKREYSTLGSGVIVNPEGYVLTNEHVIRDAERVFVTLNDGSGLDATVVGAATEFDLALLKIEGENLPFAALGNSDNLEIGEWVIAIGSPFGHLLNDTQPTVTVGVVSALDRDVKSSPDAQGVFKNMIQTDAAINPGNSGGPLVSSTGQVVGINTFIFSTGDGSNLGMGFAIPINTAKMVIDEFIHFGHVRGVWTGLEVRELTQELAQVLNIEFNSGLFIDRIFEDSPAEEAGLEVGDIIVEVNGIRVQNVKQANRSIFGLRVGDRLNLIILRNGNQMSVVLTLAERPKRA